MIIVHTLTDCAVCQDGYISIGTYSCSACNGTADKITIGVFITLLMIMVLGSWCFINDLLALDDLNTASTSASNCCTSTVQTAFKKLSKALAAIPFSALRVPLVVIQTLTQFISITGLKLPPLYEKYLRWLSLINLDMKWLLSAGCIVNIDFYGKLLTTTVLPICVIAVLGLIHLRVRYRHQPYRVITTAAALHEDSLNKAIAKHSRALLAFTFLIFSPVSTVVFQTFACDYLEGTNDSWLRADYSITCDSDRYKAYRVYGVSMILLYPLGIPALYIYMLWRHRVNLKKNNDQRDVDRTLQTTSFLWSPYTPNTYWWEVVECIRRLLLAGFLVFILPGTAGQAAVSCVFAILSTVAFSHYKPLAVPLDSKNYLLGCNILFLSMFVALLLKVDYIGADSYQSKTVFSVVLIILNLWLFLSAIFQVAFTTTAIRSSTAAIVRGGSLFGVKISKSSRRSSDTQQPLNTAVVADDSNTAVVADFSDSEQQQSSDDATAAFKTVHFDSSSSLAVPSHGDLVLHRRSLRES
jgi:hypothetical protein